MSGLPQLPLGLKSARAFRVFYFPPDEYAVLEMAMDNTPSLLFNFVRDIIYNQNEAKLDTAALNPDYRELGDGLLYLAQLLRENGEFARALANGDLSAAAERNDINAPLKALQASLRHLTWQTQQVAKGDYHQRVSYMGEFSTAFNSMVEKLEIQRASLEREIEFSHRKTKALLRGNKLLTSVTANVPDPIVVINRATKEMVYHNRSAVGAMKTYPVLRESLQGLVSAGDVEHGGEHHELSLNSPGGETHYFSVVAYGLDWDGQSAAAFLVSDISDDKERVMQLERHAYLDPLTGLHNRFFGMKTLNEWMTKKRQFVLCFVDLDFLKYINDTFGHAEGDKYLTYAASLLYKFSRESIACRVGGDEFLVLAPDYTFHSAEERFKQLRDEMTAHNQDDGRPFTYSMSYGFVEITKDNRMSPSDALSLADERMYEYKRRGKKQRSSGGGGAAGNPEAGR